jgi:hypothetical protein
MKNREKRLNKEEENLYELCLRKGLIEETKFGYIFKPEFFETLEMYEE